MLKSLKSLDPNTASKIISDVVQSLLSNPNIESKFYSDKNFTDLHSSVINEVRQRAKIHIDDNSKDAQTKLFTILSDELSKLILTKKERNEAIKRLGDRGDLSLRLYKIKFTDSFKIEFNHMVDKKLVELTIHEPDSFEHLLPERFDLDGGKNISLFTRFHLSKQLDNSFVILVEAVREKDQMTVSSAWKIFLSEVDIRDAKSPLDVLKAFVDVYGFDFIIGELYSRRFVLYDTFPIQGIHGGYPLIRPIDTSDNDFHASFYFRVNPLNVIELSIAYIINLNKYRGDLRRHGIHIIDT
jgi:Ni,Fe-hydrogenase III component G